MKVTTRLILAMIIAVVSTFAITTDGAGAAPGAADLPTRAAVRTYPYIAVFRNDMVPRAQVHAVVQELTNQHHLRVRWIFYDVLRGFQFTSTPTVAARIARDRRVAYVERDIWDRGFALPTGVQNNPPAWGLDRIDQRRLPLNRRYEYPNTASNVSVYVLDSGVRVAHREFGGRATAGGDFTPENNNVDCAGHGTHVAGTIGGSTVGVAKRVRIVSLKVLGCNNTGLTSGIIRALDTVARTGRTPGVVNLSLGHRGSDPAFNTAIANVVARGFVVVAAAGNSRADACGFTPAMAPQAVTVGATNTSDSRDTSYSNFGRCLDLFAPGTSINSAAISSNSALSRMSGTSMAAPHVAGAAAMVLSRHPRHTPAQVRQCLVTTATAGALSNVGSGSPNRMLFVGGAC